MKADEKKMKAKWMKQKIKSERKRKTARRNEKKA